MSIEHVITSLAKLALRTKRVVDKKNEENAKVYQVWMDHTYRIYETVSKDGYKSFQFEGQRVEKREFDDIFPSRYKDEVKKAFGDVFSITRSSFVINERAYDVLKTYLDKHAQVFEIESQGVKFFVVNVIEVVDCVDYEKSQIKYFQSTGRIIDIEKYVFKKEILKGITLFKIPETGSVDGLVYVTGELKKAVEENNIKGFLFKEL